MRLSPNFSLEELTTSQTAARMGREVVPNDLEKAHLQLLCIDQLERIRTLVGRPIVVSSGLRPTWLNTAIGGSKKSDHILGLAADIKAVGMSAKALFSLIHHSDIRYKQLILEFDRWVHISRPQPGESFKMQSLVAEKINGKTRYRSI